MASRNLNPASANHVERARAEGVLLGVPLGDLGWFQSLLMGTAAGFATFFAATFCSIIALLVYATAAHRQVDYAIAYRRVGFPAGLAMLVLALGFLGVQYARQAARKQRAAK